MKKAPKRFFSIYSIMFAVHFLSPYDYVHFAYLELIRHIQERLKKNQNKNSVYYVISINFVI